MLRTIPKILLVIACFLSGYVAAQEKSDTTALKKVIENIKGSKVTRRVTDAITKSADDDNQPLRKSEDLYMPYEGKIIRNIFVNPITFEQNVNDTSRNIADRVARTANKLHANSKTWMLRDMLFFRENRPLNPYKLADNERYLRDLPFIKDARINILELSHTDDSVDVEIVTRDIFSLGGSFNPRGATTTRFRLYDANLLGIGQRVQFTGFFDSDRQPAFGYDLLYTKYSVGGSLIDATLGYTQLDNGTSYGRENEDAYYIKLDRPLVSPYTSFAGGLELSKNWSSNVYKKTDSDFRNYRYRISDLWVGYNLSRLSQGRTRYFIAARGFEQHFMRAPLQRDVDSLIYINRTYVLGKISLFRQDYYKTQYIYGFGRTEDVPYGHSVSLLTGVEKVYGKDRTYFGLEGEKTFVNLKGHFYTVGLRLGAFRAAHRFQDATVLASGSFYSRIYTYKRILIRQSLNANFTKVQNQTTQLPLDINGELGLWNFRSDTTLFGTKRINIGTETVFFTPLKFLGFKFAAFGYGEMAWLANANEKFWNRTPYYGIGGGVRTRNENLVFGTIELRFVYFPRVVESIPQLRVSVTTNLRVKYTGNFVRAPSFVVYN